MSELSLSICPICRAANSLSRQERAMQERAYVWYECRECGSILLWLGSEEWAYQKVGREEKKHLLKQPLTLDDLQELLPRAEKDVPVAPITDNVAERVAGLDGKRTRARRLLPWILAVCLLGFIGLIAIAVYEAFAGSSVFATATPAPALVADTQVKLAAHDGGAVTVWQMRVGCEPGNALGQVPSGSDAVTMEDACYHLEDQFYYYRVEMVGLTPKVVPC